MENKKKKNKGMCHTDLLHNQDLIKSLAQDNELGAKVKKIDE